MAFFGAAFLAAFLAALGAAFLAAFFSFLAFWIFLWAAFGFFSYYMLWACIKGNIKFGIRFFCFTFYPMMYCLRVKV